MKLTPDQERAAIVAWLRETILSRAEASLKEAMEERELDGIVLLMAGIELVPELADAIERGEHHGEG